MNVSIFLLNIIPLSLQRTKSNFADRVFNSEFGLVIIRVNLEILYNEKETFMSFIVYLFRNFCPSVGKFKTSSLSGGKMNCRQNFRIVRFD